MAISRFSDFQDGGSDLAIFNLRGPIINSLKSSRRSSYRLSTETIALNCLVFEKIAFLCMHFGDRQTDRQTDKRTKEGTDRQSKRVKAQSLSRAAP